MTYADLVPTVMSHETFKKAFKREGLQRAQRACRARQAAVYFDSFSPKRQAKICQVLGDPRQLLGLAPAATKTERIPFSELSAKQVQLCNAKFNIVKCYREFAELNKADAGITAAKKSLSTLYNKVFSALINIRWWVQSASKPSSAGIRS